MCGIAGIFGARDPVADGVLEDMISRLSSRGPDDEGLLVEETVGLAHKRLSIIDLSKMGRQPMEDPSNRNVIVYNGEIYNYQEIRSLLKNKGHVFATASDTEVVLKAYAEWGERCPEKFIGMFAFAVWDRQADLLFLARDRLGIKPLYYFARAGFLVFASRLKALLQHPQCPGKICAQALSLYFQAGFVPAPFSILEGVCKLPAGKTLQISRQELAQSGRPTMRRYWSLEKACPDPAWAQARPQDVTDQFEALLGDAVERRLVADVPVGVFLSGGIDSSLVAALASRKQKGIRAYSIGFQEALYNELDNARDIARHLGLRHRYQVLQTSHLQQELSTFACHYDEPFADSSALPTLAVSRLARQEVTVALSGDGGDELFAGYPIYRYLRNLMIAFRLPAALRRTAAALLDRTSRRGRLLASALRQDDIHSCFSYLRSFSRGHLLPLSEDAGFPLDRLFRQHIADGSGGMIEAAFKLDLRYYLSDGILQKLDVASMAFGLEARVPILDHRVVEFALSLPLSYKLRRSQSKLMLRRLLDRHFPRQFFNRPKQGFNTPLAQWMRGELREFFQKSLAAEALSEIDFIDPSKVRRLLEIHLSNKADTSFLLWAVFCYVQWFHSHFQPSRQPAVPPLPIASLVEDG